MTSFPHLFSRIIIGDVEIPNRIVSTGHHTYLADGAPSPELIAYHRARAEGGAGLIVTEIVAAHESAGFSSQLLRADPAGAEAYATLADAVHGAGAKIFAQLFHPGREIMRTADGMAAVAYAPSAAPNERFHVMPREMSDALIREIIAGFADAIEHYVNPPSPITEEGAQRPRWRFGGVPPWMGCGGMVGILLHWWIPMLNDRQAMCLSMTGV